MKNQGASGESEENFARSDGNGFVYPCSSAADHAWVAKTAALELRKRTPAEGRGQIFGARFGEQNCHSQTSLHLYINRPCLPSLVVTRDNLNVRSEIACLASVATRVPVPSHAMLRDVLPLILVTLDRLSDDGAADPVLVRNCRWSTTFLPVLRVSSGPSPAVSPLLLDLQRNIPA